MPFWLTWFFIGTLVTGGAAALHNSNPTTTAGTNPPPQYTQDFQQQNDKN